MSKAPYIEKIKRLIRKDPGNHWIDKIKNSELSPVEKQLLLNFVVPVKKDLSDALAVDGDTSDLGDIF